MSYIGRKPTVGNFQICDAISVVNGQAAYTMQVGSVNVLPETANHMIVSLNGVIQKPNSSYTVSGSTITFASNLVTNDVIDFIQILGSVLNVGTVSDATITDAKTNFVSTSSAAGLQIKGDGTTDGTLQLNCSQNSHGIKIKSPPHSAGASYTLTMPNNDGDANQFLQTNGSGVLSFAAAGGTNTPAFQAYQGSTSTYGTTITLITCNTEVFDSDSAYDTSAYRFTPQVAGKYFFYGQIYITSPGTNLTMQCRLSKNGSAFAVGDQNSAVNRDQAVVAHGSVDLNGSSDYVDLRGYNSSSMATVAGSLYTYFGGYKLIT